MPTPSAVNATGTQPPSPSTQAAAEATASFFIFKMRSMIRLIRARRRNATHRSSAATARAHVKAVTGARKMAVSSPQGDGRGQN
jgi:hypothetical protein